VARERLSDYELAATARPNVRRPRPRIGADPGDEHEPRDAGSRRLLRDSLGALLMHRLESHAARLDIGGNGVDDGVNPGYGGGDRGLVAHVGAEDRDSVQISRSEDVPRPLGRPNRDAQRRSFGGEAPHQPPAEEPRAAEHADHGHGIAFSMAEKIGSCAREPLSVPSMVRELIEEEVNEISSAPAITRESSFIKVGFVSRGRR
jgi:hypothetical protein